jgi:hypothetical protein
LARRSRPRGAKAPDTAASERPPQHERVEEWPDGDWMVRSITGSSSTKNYRCPGCDHEIRPATPHVVAWPVELGAGLDDRRHWHTACWRARGRRAPKR